MSRLGILVLTSIMLFECFTQTRNNGTDDTEVRAETNNAASETVSEEEDYSVLTNESYADSEPYIFEGTIDEIYEDKSMLIYSPAFYPDFNYTVFVEFDENTVVNGFEPKVNQQVKFTVYSEIKKYPPLTVVARQLDLVKEVSTQRQEEAERLAELERRIQELNMQ